MPQLLRSTERRTESRYTIADFLPAWLSPVSEDAPGYTTGFTATDRGLSVGIQSSSPFNSRVMFGRLLDLSLNGTRLAMRSPLQPGEPVMVTIQLVERDIAWSFAAKICWFSAICNGDFHIGCAFDSKISDTQIADLAKAGYLERRRERRQPTSIVAYATTNSEPQDAMRVHIENISTQGLGMFSPQCFHVGDRLTLRLPPADNQAATIEVTVARQDEIDGGYYVGCRLADKNDHDTLRRIAPQSLRCTF